MTVESAGPADTEAAGADLARTLRRGEVVAVRGELGAGKTTFVRGALRELGVEGPVTSPSFTVGTLHAGHRDDGPVKIAHLDLWRLASSGREEPGLFDDYLTPDAIGFVEWPEAGAGLVARAAEVRIEHAGGDRRRITVTR